MSRSRLAVVVSHPIQYHAPWFRALAQVTKLTVFFCHEQNATGQSEAGFGVPFDWDIPLLDGYEHRFLRNRAAWANVSTFDGCDTPELADVLVQDAFDACIVSGWYLKSYLQAIRACRAAGIATFLRGDSQLDTKRAGLLSAAKYLPYRWVLGHVVDGHLFVGERNRAYLKHYGVPDAKLFFVPHFVDNAFFAERAEHARASGERAARRASAGAGPAATVFAFVGKLIPRKRPADLLHALARARARGADVRALVVGSGPLQRDLEHLARTLDVPTHFMGFRNQTELPRDLAAADALVLPSDARETWGLVVNEAMACGLPALVSRAAGCAPDLIDEGHTGHSFDLGDIVALSEAILNVHTRLQQDAAAFRELVAARIGRYSVGAAVEGTLRALAITVGGVSHARTPRESPASAGSLHG